MLYQVFPASKTVQDHIKKKKENKGGEEAAQEKEQEEDEVRKDRRRNTIEHPLINYKIINCKDHYKPAHQI